VYLTYVGTAGHAMIDRELYLPTSWTTDSQRCAAAGIPDDVEFATKPALAKTMIGRALDAGIPARWAAGDEVYGTDPGLRAELQARQVGYVLAIGCDRRVPTAAGPQRADALATSLPKAVWQRISAGAGAKGQRYYDWAWVELTAESGHHWLLVRRHPRHGELAFYHCYSPSPVPLGELVRIAGRRWTIEESFQAAKGLAGLDEHQVRRWLAWRRWTLLAMLARLTRSHRRHRTHSTSRTRRPDRFDLQRDPAPIHQADHRTQPPTHQPTGLVTLATPTPTPLLHQSLPPPTSTTHMITIYGWSTRPTITTRPRAQIPPSASVVPGIGWTRHRCARSRLPPARPS
jgi:SRSO17 transposase